MMIRRGLFVLAALCVCLSCTTATDDDVNDTILDTLNEFVDAWNSGNADAYESLLADDFTFYFDPEDVGGYWDIPTSWDHDAEITAFNNLFDTVGAENVDVALELDEVDEPDGSADTYQVNGIPYEVRVYDEAADPVPTMYLATGHLDMKLTKVGDEWVITEWWDVIPYRLPGVECTTWGVIKWLFYKE